MGSWRIQGRTTDPSHSILLPTLAGRHSPGFQMEFLPALLGDQTQAKHVLPHWAMMPPLSLSTTAVWKFLASSNKTHVNIRLCVWAWRTKLCFMGKRREWSLLMGNGTMTLAEKCGTEQPVLLNAQLNTTLWCKYFDTVWSPLSCQQKELSRQDSWEQRTHRSNKYWVLNLHPLLLR